jgi:hypothetical protein
MLGPSPRPAHELADLCGEDLGWGVAEGDSCKDFTYGGGIMVSCILDIAVIILGRKVGICTRTRFSGSISSQGPRVPAKPTGDLGWFLSARDRRTKSCPLCESRTFHRRPKWTASSRHRPRAQHNWLGAPFRNHAVLSIAWAASTTYV